MPSFNPDRAEVPLALPGGPTLKLVLDYQAVGALQAKLGDQWDGEVDRAFGSYDCRKICEILEILAAKHHPDITADALMEISPPLSPTNVAVNAAMQVFLYGRHGPPPKPAIAEDGEVEGEESPLANGQAGATQSARLFQRLLQRVYGQPSSGA